MLKLVMLRSALIAFACALSVAAHAYAADPKRVDVPAGDLTAALETLAKQSGVELVYQTDQLKGLRTQGVTGNFSPEEAVTKLLEGTKLTLKRDTSGAMLIALPRASSNSETPEPGSHSSRTPPVPQADEGLNGLSLAQDQSAQQSDSNTSGQSPEEKKNPQSPQKDSEESLSEVVVVGSRLRQRPDEGPSPVTVIDRAKIEQIGASQIADVLRYLPQQPFSNNDQNYMGGERAVRMRGLSLGLTLILINGRRTVTSALNQSFNFFDLNMIPLSAVERIEVLADSASAIYGADAVGGVVNIILKDEIAAPVVDLYYGGADGGGEEGRVSLALGHATQRLRGTAVVDYFDRNLLLGEHREFQSNQDFRRFGGSDLRSAFSNPTTICAAGGGNLNGLGTACAAVPAGSSGVGLTPASFAATAGLTNRESLARYGSVVPKTERLNAGLFGEFDLTARTRIFGEFLYAHRDDERRGAPASLQVTVPAANIFNPFGQSVTATYLFTGLGGRPDIAESELFRAVAGLRGGFGAWDWELAVLNTDEDASNQVRNPINSASVTASLAASDPAQVLNVFQDGPGGSPALLRSLLGTATVNRFSSEALQVSAFVRGGLFALPAGRVEGVLGGETREENTVFNGFGFFLAPERKVWSSFGELRAPLVNSAMQWPAVRSLALTAALRYDHYDDFGGTLNPQFGLEWSLSESLLLRGSVASSFRAPSLFELYAPQTPFPVAIADPRRNNENTPASVITGGNPALDPEEADSYTAGFVLNLERFAQARISGSYWSIKESERVQQLSYLLVLANENVFSNRIARAAQTPQDIVAGLPGRLVSVDSSSVNFGRLETNGIDLSLSAAFDTGLGRFSPSLATTWVRTFEAADVPNAPALDRVGVANFNGTIPEWRGTATLDWSRRGFGASATARYFSSYDDVTQSNVRTGRIIPSQTLVDLQFSANVAEAFATSAAWLQGLTMRMGVLNVLDETPNFSGSGGSSGFDPTQSDVRQRFGYLSVSKSF